MARYAEHTEVSVEKSRAEIEATLSRYGAEQFSYGIDSVRGIAEIKFATHDRCVRFILKLPKRDEERFWFTKHKNRYHRKRVDELTAARNWEQGCRQSWRALALCIKAKLEAVAAGISEFEDEFLAHIVLPNGQTVSQLMRPQIAAAYISQDMPRGLAGFLPAPDDDVIEANP